MDTTIDRPGTRAFDPESMAGAPTPPRPGWDLGPERRVDDGQTLANALGWFSIGLGLLEVLAPEKVCDYLGMEDREGLVRFYGFREIASGVGILSQRRPTGWIAGRIAGDALDLATLGAYTGDDNPNRDRVMGAIAAVAGVSALDALCLRQLTSEPS
jgi:hypothetical protein